MPINYRSDYRSSGVNVEAGDQLVQWLQSNSESQIHSDKILDGIGGFASLFKLNFPQISKPVLVSSTDGVGTKVKLAVDFDRLEGIGQDLVAMCVNDLLTTGAMPLFFLDYYATGKLDLQQAQSFLTGLKKACAQARIALVGGETAEMPGVYHGRDIDCAGFSVGLVDEDKILGAQRVRPGDLVLGISSSGCHSNGYSLLRKVFESDMKAWIDQLLTPTHLYTDLTQKLNSHVHAYANITGGGVDNIPRVIPKTCSLKLQTWDWPGIFKEVQTRTKMSSKEMLRTLNCGIGYVVICAKDKKEFVLKAASEENFKVIPVGEIISEAVEDQIRWPKEWD